MMIEIKSVSLDYGVKDLDLTIKKGEFLLLCGRSGCGKTTVTRLINGLIPEFYPAEMTGDVFVDGGACAGYADVSDRRAGRLGFSEPAHTVF